MAALAERLLPNIRAILAKSDLSTVSAKGVRKELVRRGADEVAVKEARKEIDVKISEIYDQLTSNPAPSSSSSRPTQHASSSSYPYARPSTPPAAMPPTSQPMPLTDIKPEKREPGAAYSYVKEEIARLPVAKMETDEQMAARLQAEFDSMSGGRASRNAASTKAKRKKRPAAAAAAGAKKRKSRAEVGSDEDADAVEGEKKKRKGGGGGAFNKDLVLSDTLAALVGEQMLSRPQTVKRIWQYVKERDLQDPADKRFIICDDKLRSVFHSDKIHMFTMNKILATHFMDPDELVDGRPQGRADVKPGSGGIAKVENGDTGAMALPPRSYGTSQNAVDVDGDESEEDEDEDGYY